MEFRKNKDETDPTKIDALREK